jgi:hypothetical protein
MAWKRQDWIGRHGSARHSVVGQGRHGEAGHGAVRRGDAGVVRRGVAEYGGVRQAWHGGKRCGRAWIG